MYSPDFKVLPIVVKTIFDIYNRVKQILVIDIPFKLSEKRSGVLLYLSHTKYFPIFAFYKKTKVCEFFLYYYYFYQRLSFRR